MSDTDKRQADTLKIVKKVNRVHENYAVTAQICQNLWCKVQPKKKN